MVHPGSSKEQVCDCHFLACTLDKVAPVRHGCTSRMFTWTLWKLVGQARCVGSVPTPSKAHTLAQAAHQ
jgi:hypothetical protein